LSARPWTGAAGRGESPEAPPVGAESGEWLSWPQAAELASCPVPTIDWYVREGRIKHRPAHGKRPSLERESVEAFAVWLAERNGERERRRADRERRMAQWLEPPDPTGWLSVPEAADAAGVIPRHVLWLIAHEKLDSVRRGRRVWVRETSVQRFVAERAADAQEWVSHVDAARIVGCSTPTILKAANAGEIERRQVPRALPSLRRRSVEAFAETWRGRR
jgi:hypothetical protein